MRDVDLRGADSRVFAPWQWRWRGPLDWDFAFNGDVALDLSIESGMGDTRLDLSALRVTDLTLQTGMSATEVTLPAKVGHTRIKIRAGMAEVKVYVPEGWRPVSTRRAGCPTCRQTTVASRAVAACINRRGTTRPSTRSK